MHTFTISYDRHKGRYSFKLKDFPETYNPNLPWYDFIRDPDWLDKFRYKRLNLKFWLSFLAINGLGMLYLSERTKKYDADFRKMQREALAIENKEIVGKKAKFRLFDKNNVEFTGFGYNYTILWYDARMKNYIKLISELPQKHLVTNRIVPILIVEKVEHMTKIYDFEKDITKTQSTTRISNLYSGTLNDNATSANNAIELK